MRTTYFTWFKLRTGYEFMQMHNRVGLELGELVHLRAR